MSSNIWITSDWHFNHDKPFVWGERGFNSVEEMNQEIIRRHNSVVAQNDLVYCLGDCCLGGADASELNKKLIEQLNGKIYIIRGNHCTDRRIAMYNDCKNVIKTGDYAQMIKKGKYRFYLSHFPTAVGNYDDEKVHSKLYSLCGHTHTKDRWKDFSLMKAYHVELDAHNCYPVLLDDIIRDIRERNKTNA